MNREVIILLFPILAAVCAGLSTELVARTTALLCYLSGFVYGILLMPGIWFQSSSVIVGSGITNLGINLFFSPFTLGVVTVIYFLALLIILSDYHAARHRHFYLLHLLFTLSQVGLVLSGDLFNLYIFLELAVVSSFVLAVTAREGGNPAALVKYLIWAQLFLFLMLGGECVIYSATGNLNIAVLSRFGSLKPIIAHLCAGLLLVPLLFCGTFFPLHIRVGRASEGSQSLSASLSGIMSLVGGVVLARLLLTLLNPASVLAPAVDNLRIMLLLLGLATVLYGETQALGAKKISSLLSFSTVGQVGVAIIALSIAHPASLRGAILLLVGHSFIKILLFFVLDFFYRQTGCTMWTEMRGIGIRFPFAGASFFLLALALVGVPLSSGFRAKMAIIRGALEAGGIYSLGLIGALAGAVIPAIYFIRMAITFYTVKKQTSPRRHMGTTGHWISFTITVLVLGVAILLLSLHPSGFELWLFSSVHELLNPGTEYSKVSSVNFRSAMI